MRKRTFLLLLCVVLWLSMLTACGGEPTNNTPTTTADSTTTTTTTTKFSGTKMTFAQGPNQTQPAATTSKPKPTASLPTEVNGVPVPKAAYDEGMVKLAFQDEFDTMATFDFSGQSLPGKNWYIDSDLNKSQPTTKDYKILAERDGAKGVMALEPVTSETFDFTTYARKTDSGYLWHFGYAECRMRFDVDNVPPLQSYGGTRVGWPSFWARNVHDYDQASFPQKDEHSVELDMMEAWPFKDSDPSKGICFSGALHHWIHKSVTGTGQNKDCSLGYAMGKVGGRSESYRIDSGWHTYAALWKEGYVAWYMDGKFMHAVEFAEGEMPLCYIGDPDTPIEKPPSDLFEGMFAVLNNQQMVITLGGGDTVWPQYIDFVRIWEFDD